MKPEPFQLERYFAQHEFKAPHLLCCSDCETLTVRELLKYEPGAHEDFLSLRLGYTESLGDPRLRHRISSLYKTVSSEEILVHAGAEEAIFNFMNVVLEAGDQIIVHAPYYQSLGEVARSIGAKVVEWRGNPAQSWELDLNFLEKALTDQTKVVAVNFPHNPTGFLPSSDFMTRLSRLSDDHGFMVFSDEVYRGLEYDAGYCLPAFADLNQRGVSLGVMSKTYGLAGLRIGWIATRHRGLFKKLAAFKDYTTICNSAPSEFLAALALKHQKSIVERNLKIIRKNLLLLEAFFSRQGERFDWHAPKAGPISFPRYLGGSVEDFCGQLLDDAGVLLLPGTLFGKAYDCFRIGFGRADMEESLSVLEQFLDKQ